MIWWFLIGMVLGLGVGVPVALYFVRRQVLRARVHERRAVSAERLAEMGTLSSGLAHEIKNPLSTLTLNVQLLREDADDLIRELPPDSVEPDTVSRLNRRTDAIVREVQRLRGILEDFLRFAGRMKLDKTEVDLNALLDEMTDFFAPQAQSANIRLRTQYSPGPLLVEADVPLLKQAVLNLLINATQAMTDAKTGDKPHGGCNELIIRTLRAKNLWQEEAQVHITDTGPGMSAETLAKVFQPYFTTKRGGTGLGLPTTRRIIEEHGGSLAVHSEPGRGSDFVIALPAKP